VHSPQVNLSRGKTVSGTVSKCVRPFYGFVGQIVSDFLPFGVVSRMLSVAKGARKTSVQLGAGCMQLRE
jgi:hypothetical protein